MRSKRPYQQSSSLRAQGSYSLQQLVWLRLPAAPSHPRVRRKDRWLCSPHASPLEVVAIAPPERDLRPPQPGAGEVPVLCSPTCFQAGECEQAVGESRRRSKGSLSLSRQPAAAFAAPQGSTCPAAAGPPVRHPSPFRWRTPQACSC